MTEQTFAAGDQSTARTYLAGNYNDQMARLTNATRALVIPLPSLTLSDTGSSDLSVALANHSLAYAGYRNLPATYHL